MKIFHILNGDALKDKLQSTDIPGEFIICRECLIEGDVSAKSINQFWDLRAQHLSETYGVSAQEFYGRCVSEFEKIINLPVNSEINLWFENDLFCQVNMWFILSLISKLKSPVNVYRIFPVINSSSDIWKGFGVSDDVMLRQSLENRVKFQSSDIKLGNTLWFAYRTNDFKSLEKISHTNSNCFEYLEGVCRAHIERFPENDKHGRPERVLDEIIASGSKNFSKVFKEFSDREGIYGFGDLQVKNIYDKLI